MKLNPFVKGTSSENRQIGITRKGQDFVEKEIPLIDDMILQKKQIDMPLSDDVIQALLTHLVEYRNGEISLLQYAVQKIKTGNNKPITLRKTIESYFKNKDMGYKITENVLIAMTGSVIGKLVELGFIKIKNDAQKSIYKITDSSQILLSMEINSDKV